MAMRNHLLRQPYSRPLSISSWTRVHSTALAATTTIRTHHHHTSFSHTLTKSTTPVRRPCHLQQYRQRQYPSNELRTCAISTLEPTSSSNVHSESTTKRPTDDINITLEESLTTTLTRPELARNPQSLLDAFARLDHACQEKKHILPSIDANLLECLLEAWSRTFFVLKLALELRRRNDDAIFSQQNVQAWSGPDVPLFHASYAAYYKWPFRQEHGMAMSVAAEWRDTIQSEADFETSSDATFLQQLDCTTVLQKVHQYLDEGLVPPCTSIFNVILQTMSKLEKQEDAMTNLFYWMDGKSETKPNPQTAMSVMKYFAHSNQPQACQAFFQSHLPLMDLEHVRLVIEAWRSDALAVKEFHDWICQNSSLELDTYTKNKILEKWSLLPSKKQIPPIDQLLVQLIPSPKDRDSYSYSTLFRGLYEIRANVERAEPFHQEMLDRGMIPSEWHYVNLINLYAESEKCEAMEQMYHEFLSHATGAVAQRIRRGIFKARLRAWSSVGDPDMCQQVLDEMVASGFAADVVDYNRVLTAWLKGSDPNASERIEALMMRMERLADSGKLSCRPNTTSYNIRIASLTKSKTLVGAQLAEECFDEMRMRNIRPDGITYSTLIDCWTALGMYDRVQYLFESGKRSLRKKNERKETPEIYRMALRAWERAGEGERAENVLNEMMNLYEADGLSKPPNTIDFTMVLGAWSRSRDEDAGEKAESWLRRMSSYATDQRFPSLPNKYSYAQCISAWSSSSAPDAGERALVLLDECKFLSKSNERNTYTDSNPDFGHYSMAIVALARSLPYKPDPTETEYKIMALMEELGGQKESFWMQNRHLATARFRRVRSCLETSEFGKKDVFLLKWASLEETIIRSL